MLVNNCLSKQLFLNSDISYAKAESNVGYQE